jgi:hypothetical protein
MEMRTVSSVRQKPGSAKGAMFITIEDESGVANLVVWTSLCERQRRIFLGASMIAVKGRVLEGEVIHLVANRLTDLAAELTGVGDRDDAVPLPHGQGVEFHRGSPGNDRRSFAAQGVSARVTSICVDNSDSHKIDYGIYSYFREQAAFRLHDHHLGRFRRSALIFAPLLQRSASVPSAPVTSALAALMSISTSLSISQRAYIKVTPLTPSLS